MKEISPSVVPTLHQVHEYFRIPPMLWDLARLRICMVTHVANKLMRSKGLDLRNPVASHKTTKERR